MSLTQDDVRRRINDAFAINTPHSSTTFAAKSRELVLTGGQAKLTLSPAEMMATRDLSASVASAGGALVGTEMLPMAQIIMGAELADLGVTVVTGLAGPATIPRTAVLPTTAWITAEGANIGETQPTLGQIAITPHHLSAFTDASRQLFLQAGEGVVDAVVRSGLTESTRRATFTALFTGTGSAGAPLGLLATANIGTESGTSLGAAGLRAMLRKVLAAGAGETNVRFVADPATAELLGSREFSAGSGLPCWHAGEILGRPAIATSLMPANTIVAADFSRATVWVFDRDGLGLEIDGFSTFASGLVRMRLITPIDFSFSPAAAICISTSVT